MSLALPTAANVPPNELNAYKILISGFKKIGKTSLAAAFPNCFILQGEPGNSRALPARQVDITDWKMLKQYVALLQKEPKYCDTLIVDDVPSFYNLCMDYCGDLFGWEHPSDVGYGKAWKQLEKEFSQEINLLNSLPCGVIYTAHTAYKEIETRHGKKYQRLETTMTGQCDKVMDAVIQLWTVMEYDENKNRVLTLRGNDFVKAGCGLNNHFLYTDGTPIEKIELGASAEEGYSNLIKAFDNKLPNPLDTSNYDMSGSIDGAIHTDEKGKYKIIERDGKKGKVRL